MAAKKPTAAPTKTAAKKPAAAAPAKAAAKKPAASGVAFVDANFRLAVINQLLDSGHFADGFEEAQESASEVSDHETDPRVQKFLDSLTLTEELLAQIVSLAPDGGDEVYAGLVPVWDGEDDRFDVASLEDVRLLPNLERVSLYAMVREGIDLTPLRDHPALQIVNVSLPKSAVKGWSVLDELAARGVQVTRS
jgi:hypothetical protein